jgi:hypothetical protein
MALAPPQNSIHSSSGKDTSLKLSSRRRVINIAITGAMAIKPLITQPLGVTLPLSHDF